MSWKDNPFAVAAATSIATITLGVTVVFTVVIPTWLKHQENTLAAQQTQIRDLEAEVTRLKAILEQSESDNVKLRRDLDKLSPDSLFSVDDPYPKGFRAVRIGDRIQVVSQVYSADADIEDTESWIRVLLRRPRLVRMIAYYYDEKAKVKTVTGILFFFEDGDVLKKEQLIAKFGRATMRETKRGGITTLVWSGIQNLTLEFSGDRLSIMPQRK